MAALASSSPGEGAIRYLFTRRLETVALAPAGTDPAAFEERVSFWFGNLDDAERWVRDVLGDADGGRQLRAALVRAGVPQVWALDERALVRAVARELASGSLVAFRRREPRNTVSLAPRVPKPPEPAPAPAPARKLKILTCDDHFAPGAEQLDVTFELGGVDGAVKIEVTSATHSPALVHEAKIEAPGDGVRTWRWNGATTCASGKLAGRHVNPLYAPYKVKVSGDGLSDEAEFKVYYHGVRVALGTWVEDAPPTKADGVKWVQHRLNELGYLAGPVDGTKGDQLKRAVGRYSAAIPGMVELQDDTDAELQKHLEKGDGKRFLLDGDGLPKRGEETFAWIDSDIFYESDAEWNGVSAHVDKEAEKLDRFELPLEAQVLLVGKGDAKGTGAGVVAPRAVGDELRVEWVAHDPVEGTGHLPASTATAPTKVKAYVEAALAHTGQVAGNADDANDNCPTAQGGVRGTNADWFRAGDKLPPFQTTAEGARVFTFPHQDEAKAKGKLGKAGVLFRGSYVAGDNYVIEVKLALDKSPNAGSVTQAHEALTGKKIAETLSVKTGTIKLWRRHHLSAVVNWPAPRTAFVWADVERAYRVASCHLVTNQRGTLAIGELWATQAERDAFLDLFARHFPAATRADLAFREDGLWPEPLRSQGRSEAPQDYRRYVRQQAGNASGNDAFLMELGAELRKAVKKRHGTGAIIANVNWTPPVKVRNLLPILGIVNPLWSTRFVPAVSCLGEGSGVAYLDNEMTPDEQDGFLVAHEVGHCRFLKHHETDATNPSDNPDDHDTADHNCTMCYPEGISSRPGLGWTRADATTPTFCGKCVLKLRGWKVATGLPASS